MSGVDREFAGTEQSIGAMQSRLDALEARVGNGLARLPTGTPQWTFATIPPPGTLLLQGQTVLRADYPALWQWSIARAAVGFGPGDGSTTFTLPNVQGRVLIGAGTLGADVYAAGATGGAATKALLTANMPAHDHNVTSTLTHQGHAHAVFSGGSHGGHFPAGDSLLVPQGSFYGVPSWLDNGSSGGGHQHGMTVEEVASHTVNESVVGSDSPLDVRQPYLAVHWLIWT